MISPYRKFRYIAATEKVTPIYRYGVHFRHTEQPNSLNVLSISPCPDQLANEINQAFIILVAIHNAHNDMQR